MTTLQAVNELLAAIGEPPVTALDTGGVSEQAEAETWLDAERTKLLMRGWNCNVDPEVELKVPNTRINVSGGSGTFTFGETVTESVSGATGTFKYIATGSPDQMYLVRVTGTFTGGQTLTGGTSGATRTGGTYAAVTTAKHALDSNWKTVLPADREWQPFARRGDFLWDPAELTFNWTAPLWVKTYTLLSFTDLPQSLAEYVARSAAVNFQRYKKRGSADEAVLMQRALAAKVMAEREDAEAGRVNLTTTAEARRVKGWRTPFSGGESL